MEIVFRKELEESVIRPYCTSSQPVYRNSLVHKEYAVTTTLAQKSHLLARLTSELAEQYKKQAGALQFTDEGTLRSKISPLFNICLDIHCSQLQYRKKGTLARPGFLFTRQIPVVEAFPMYCVEGNILYTAGGIGANPAPVIITLQSLKYMVRVIPSTEMLNHFKDKRKRIRIPAHQRQRKNASNDGENDSPFAEWLDYVTIEDEQPRRTRAREPAQHEVLGSALFHFQEHNSGGKKHCGNTCTNETDFKERRIKQ